VRPATDACQAIPRSAGSAERHIEKTRRDELLARMTDLVLAEGFTHTSTDDLASRLRCSKATLYAIESGKMPLVAAALRRFLSDAAAAGEQRISGIADPAAQVRAYLTVIGRELRRISPACYRDIMSHDLTSDVYLGQVAAMADRLREQIRHGVRDGSFRPLHAQFLAEAVTLITHAYQDGRLTGRARLSFADAQGHLTDLVVATLTNTAYQPLSVLIPRDQGGVTRP
jgi:AcrR family transcriptional regulator